MRNLPHLLEGCGVSDVVISFLDFIPCEELQSEVIAPATEAEHEELRSCLEEVKEEGRLHHLTSTILWNRWGREKDRCTENVHRCTENVQRAVCIASDGSVSPCVYTNMQVPGACYVPQGEKRQYERMVFGNIQEKSLRKIWQERGYAAFRNSFQKGELSSHCVRCPKLGRL